MLKEYQGQAAYQRATDSYGGVSDVYLRPNGVLNPVEGSVPVAPSVEGKKTLRLSASPVNGGTVSGWLLRQGEPREHQCGGLGRLHLQSLE